jgi:hypothetical protein
MNHPFAVAKSAGLEFPLRTSLFWQHNGKARSTWDYLAQDAASYNPALVAKQAEYNCNAMTSMIYNMVDPFKAVVNPFVGKPSAKAVMAGMDKWDLDECARWVGLLKPFTDPRLAFIPCIFCGDDAATTRNEQFQDYVLPAFCLGLNQFSKAYVIVSEASKSMGIALQERMIERMRRHTKLPIGVHNQGWQIAGNADFLCYEFSWHPSTANNRNVLEVENEAKKVLASYPGYVWFQEINTANESMIARAQARKLRDLAQTEPRIIGLPGPI